MGFPSDATNPTTSSPTMNATLPTPAQSPSPQKKWKGFPMPIADSSGDVFELDVSRPDGYTGPEWALGLALNRFPVNTTIWYGSHILRGKIYYLPALFFQLYERFLDISPSDSPQLSDPNCTPWAVMHAIHGTTWVEENILYLSGTNTTHLENQEPRFVAVTDNVEVFNRAASNELPLGRIDVHGVFAAQTYQRSSNDIIVALPCGKPLLGYRSAPLLVDRALMVRPVVTPEWLIRSITIKDLLPAPTTTDVLDAVSKIVSAGDDPRSLTNGMPKKTWLTKTLPDHFGEIPLRLPSLSPPLLRPAPSTSPSPTPMMPQRSSGPRPGHGQRMTLNHSSPLWLHRGNEALLKRGVWQQMCYPSGTNDTNVEGKGRIKIPDPYAQVLFEDLQARKRVPGTEELAEVAREWYVWDGCYYEVTSEGQLSVVVPVKRDESESAEVSPGGVEGLLDVMGKAGSEESVGESMDLD